MASSKDNLIITAPARGVCYSQGLCRLDILFGILSLPTRFNNVNLTYSGVWMKAQKHITVLMQIFEKTNIWVSFLANNPHYGNIIFKNRVCVCVSRIHWPPSSLFFCFCTLSLSFPFFCVLLLFCPRFSPGPVLELHTQGAGRLPCVFVAEALC